jgi:chromosome segregation ATPase
MPKLSINCGKSVPCWSPIIKSCKHDSLKYQRLAHTRRKLKTITYLDRQRANKLRGEHAASQSSHNNRRHQLDLHLAEVDDLRRALLNQADELHRAEEEKNHIASQKSDVARNVALLESDLKRVRKDAEAFGHDLKHLRAEKEKWDAKQRDEAAKAERARKQSQTQIRLLNEQLDSQREKVRRIKEDLRNHVCAPKYVLSILYSHRQQQKHSAGMIASCQ